MDPKQVAPNQKLELYVKPSCPYCADAFAYYNGRGIAYTVHDAQNDAEARRRMFTLSGGDPTVPTIVVDGVYVQSGWGSPPKG